ncbi:RNA-directed DNA polymerase [Aeromonas veronii]
MRQPNHHYFLQLDIHSYFNSIPREGLSECWNNILRLTPLSEERRELLRQIGTKSFLHDASRHPYTVSGAQALLKRIPTHKQLCFRGATHGIPIGSLTSQILANFYLHPLDLFIKHELRVKGYVRYMDDLILMSATPAQLNQWREAIKAFLTHQLGLTLHPTKQQLQPVSQGARYLGYRVFAHHCWLLPRTCNTLKQRLAWFNHLLQPSDKPLNTPARGLWARPEMQAPPINLALLRNMLATINSYYGLLHHGKHWRLRQRIYHQHFGLLKHFFIPANAGYTHIKLKKCFLQQAT